ncbi:MAG: DUF421 domain-containing protein [Clostridiales bacterium]|nr:DUF421 domain-containing protein [Clostridiales bacterium]
MIVFIRTIILYIFVVIVMRAMGKRQIGELQPFELVIALMLSELATLPMEDTKIPLIHSIIPIVTLMALEITISFLTLKFEFLRKVFCGTPDILIKHGKVSEEELRRQRFNLDDLIEELRMMGYVDISDIEYAILETSGKLSIIPKAEKSPVSKEDLNIKPQAIKLPISIILDGVLNKKNLAITGHDMHWLEENLKSKGINNIDEVFIAMIDSKGQLFIQRRDKNEHKS